MKIIKPLYGTFRENFILEDGIKIAVRGKIIKMVRDLNSSQENITIEDSF